MAYYVGCVLEWISVPEIGVLHGLCLILELTSMPYIGKPLGGIHLDLDYPKHIARSLCTDAYYVDAFWSGSPCHRLAYYMGLAFILE